MLSSVIVFIVILFLALIMFVLFNAEKKRKDAIHLQTVVFTEVINDLKQRYKLDVETICETLDLTKLAKDKLYMIANNYFVFQSISEEAIECFRTTLNKLSYSYNHLLEHYEEYENIDIVHEKIVSFSESLPLESRGFNVSFYDTKIHELNKLLALDIDIAVDESDIDEPTLEDSTKITEHDGAISAA